MKINTLFAALMASAFMASSIPAYAGVTEDSQPHAEVEVEVSEGTRDAAEMSQTGIEDRVRTVETVENKAAKDVAKAAKDAAKAEKKAAKDAEKAAKDAAQATKK